VSRSSNINAARSIAPGRERERTRESGTPETASPTTPPPPAGDNNRPDDSFVFSLSLSLSLSLSRLVVPVVVYRKYRAELFDRRLPANWNRETFANLAAAK